MRKTLFILTISLVCLYVASCGPSKLQRRMSSPYFDPRSEYRNTVPKVNLEFKGIPTMESFKSNYDIETIQIDDVGERKFISDSLWPRINSMFRKESRSYEGKKKFEVFILKSGARVILPTDKNDKRIFISVYPGYYFVIRGPIIWTSCYVDSYGKVFGTLDPANIVRDQVKYIKYHLSSGLVSGK